MKVGSGAWSPDRVEAFKFAPLSADTHLMKMNRQQLDDLGRELGLRELLHGPSDLTRACLIARDGIRPGNEVESLGLDRVWGQYQLSRDGYVYLGEANYIAEMVDTADVMFAVPLSEIDPARLACDEDHVSIYLTARDWATGYRHAAELLPEAFRIARWPGRAKAGQVAWRRNGPLAQPLTKRRYKQTGMTQGQWANLPRNAAALARPEFVHASVTVGSVAHQGTILPSALRLNIDWWDHSIVRNQGAQWLDYMALLSVAAAVCLLVRDTDDQKTYLEELLASAQTMDETVAASRIRSLAGNLEAVLAAIDEVEHHLLGKAMAKRDATRELEINKHKMAA